jgi:electron transport complex protein RnfC
MRQFDGEPAQCVVRPGDAVREGMLIGRGPVPVHASIPGTVTGIGELADRWGGVSAAVVIELGGEFERSGRARPVRRWESLDRAALLAAVQAAGIIHMGRKPVPLHLALQRRAGAEPATLVASAVRDDPSGSAVAALLAGRAAELVEGIRIAARILGPGRTVVAVGAGDREHVPALERALDAQGAEAEIVVVDSRYPQADEELLAGRLARADAARMAMLGAASLLALQDAVVHDRPLIETIVGVGGSVVRSPRALKARIGASVGDLLEECGGCTEQPAGIVLGGLMTGRLASSADVPLTKDVTGVIALSAREARAPRALPCIRCGACIDACPWGLDPGSLCKLVEHGRMADARAGGLDACSLCGCCAHVCPSRIPLAAHLAEGLRARGRQ